MTRGGLLGRADNVTRLSCSGVVSGHRRELLLPAKPEGTFRRFTVAKDHSTNEKESARAQRPAAA